ncbi:hypothetical protein JMJ35_007630 [Cladonia borealis]|uniref:Uncharacterized protein n=1 Tax=Cladonia borealis TaxID=184061 RepID=A0AA39U8C7_9LECA|nr:hypothetical protein JMJ35_007630 [Cladonia borealis]
MASATTSSGTGNMSTSSKLARLPKNARVQKRPILRPSIPSPYTGASQQKVIYVSAKTPFISAVKRVRKLLSEIDRRSTGKIDLVNGKGNEKQKLMALREKTMSMGKGKEVEAVVLKGTNRAIEKVLELGLYFQGQDDCMVRLRTGSVSVVDDIVQEEEEGGVEEGEGEELPESRVRKISVVEVAVTLK